MKKCFALIITMLLSVEANCQETQINSINDPINGIAMNKSYYPEPLTTQGSPYIMKSFTIAEVANVAQKAVMRYNVYKDELEFIDEKSDTLILNKVETFSTITFKATNTKYQLVTYNNKGKVITGYLIWLFEKNNFVLFKKQNISFTPQRVAQSGYEKDRPPSYQKEKDTYFFKNGDKGISDFSANKKGLIKLFPEKKADIETFVKENNIDFDKEADLIKVVTFLAG